MSQPGFWDSQEAAQKVVDEKKKVAAVVDPIDKVTGLLEDAEIMIEARRKRLRVVEVPVPFLARERGKSNVRASTAWEFLRNMVRHRLGR